MNKRQADFSFSKETLANFFKIDISVIPAKFAYFLFTARASYQAYLVLFLMNIGLSASQAGLINGLRLMGGTIGAPFWTFMADTFKSHRKILPIVTLLAITTMTCYPFLTFLFPKSETNYCFDNFTRSDNATDSKSKEEFGSMNLFLVMLFASIFISFFDGSLLCFIDSATVFRCNSGTSKKKYAHQRIFECFGWPFGVFIIGLFVDYFPFQDITCYAGIYLFYPIVMVLLFINDIFLLHNTDFSRQMKSEEKTENSVWSTVRKLLSKTEHILFLLSICALGAGQGIYEGFTFPLLTEFGASTSDTTIFSVIAGVASFFAFIFGEYLLHYAKDIWLIIAACSALYTIRYPIFYFVSNPDILLVTSIFQVGHIIFIMAMVRHIDDHYPSAVATTFFGLANAGYYAFGYGLANIVGGIIYNNYGGKSLFFGIACGFAVWAIGIIIYRFCLQKKCIESNINTKNHEKSENSSNEKVVCYFNSAVEMT